MPEENINPNLSGEGQQPPEGGQLPPEGGGEPQLPQEGATPPPEGEGEPTPAELNRIQSWIGRREKQLKDEITQLIRQGQQEILQYIPQVIQQHVPQAGGGQQPPEGPTWDPYDPNLVERKVYDTLTKVTTQQQQYGQAVTGNFARLMNMDEDARGNDELKQEIFAEAQKLPGKMNLDPASHAEYLFDKAKAKVLSGKMRQKTNPFANKGLPNQPMGNINPSSNPKPTVRLPKFDDVTLELKRKLGLTEDDMSKIKWEE